MYYTYNIYHVYFICTIYAEIYDYLRLLYSRIGVAYSYKTGEKMVSYTESMIINLVLNDFNNK